MPEKLSMPRLLAFLDANEKKELGAAFLEQLKNFVDKLDQPPYDKLDKELESPRISFIFQFLTTASQSISLHIILHKLESFLCDNLHGRYKLFEALIKELVYNFLQNNGIIIAPYWQLSSQDKQVLKKFREPKKDNLNKLSDDFGTQARRAIDL